MPDRTHTSAVTARDSSLEGRVTRDPGRRGSTVVEFSLVFILFLVLIVSLLEIGGTVWTYTTVTFAARQGVRFAMVHGSANPVLDGEGNDITDDQVEAVVQANAIGLDPNKLVVLPGRRTAVAAASSSFGSAIPTPSWLARSFFPKTPSSSAPRPGSWWPTEGLRKLNLN